MLAGADGVNAENATGLNAGESITIKDITIHAIAAAIIRITAGMIAGKTVRE